ncbi:hypothetical protein GV828_09325 [Flavobacterium sp. NST-5]|uniref:Uncharacterized protein n=1 Tax=Flavobacterium ichthyis TaxID=2698827 RepID=A0ABW9ZDK5_9FLAO|nr:hypothetical protein [Flavobacterium ichthyis]NBL65397.1 hypothetical protein [Flavobacterium ichthyis]
MITKILNIIIIFLFLTQISCNQKKNFDSKQKNTNLKTATIDFNTDSVYYRLNVGHENNNYYQDEKSNLVYLVTREVYVDDINFGAFNNEMNMFKAGNYSKENG